MIARAVFYAIASFIITFNVFSQRSDLRLDVDFAQFRGTGDSLYIELYYSFAANGLTYTHNDDGFKGAVELEVDVRDAASLPLKETTFRMNYAVPDTTGKSLNQTVVGLSGFFIPPGDYTLKVRGYDVEKPDKVDSISLPLRLSDIPESHIGMSDLQFANSIRQIPEEPANTFYKNTLEVIPNPSRIFGVGHPILFYYLEVYNLLASSDVGDGYTIRTVVYDAVGNQYFNRESEKKIQHESSVEVGTVNTTAFKSGTYTLTIAIIEPSSDLMVTSSRRFFVFNPQHGVADDMRDAVSAGAIASIYGVMNEEELDKEFEEMRYITSSRERRDFSNLSTKAEKQRYLFEYWHRLDPNPTTPDNPIRREYRDRVDHANQQFGFGFREGWRTDRGRIYITYGTPDEYERYPSRSDTKPFEIWYYNHIQGGVKFVFVDRTGFQDYQLVHSTHRSELRDDNWQEYIRQN